MYPKNPKIDTTAFEAGLIATNYYLSQMLSLSGYQLNPADYVYKLIGNDAVENDVINSNFKIAQTPIRARNKTTKPNFEKSSF